MFRWSAEKLQRMMMAGLLCAVAVSCSMSPEPQQPLSCDEKKALADEYWGIGLTAETSPGFEEDILPILASTDDGKVYKCTVCHSKYNELDVTKDQFANILTSIGPNGTMPRGDGDRVSDRDRELLVAWQKAGFPKNRQTLRTSADTDTDTKVNPDSGRGKSNTSTDQAGRQNPYSGSQKTSPKSSGSAERDAAVDENGRCRY